MEPLVSGSTTERIIRTSLVTFLAAGAAGWCFYDAVRGYPMENLRRAVNDLTPQPEATPAMINPKLTTQAAKELSLPPGAFLKDLVARFGEPGWRGVNPQGKTEAHFFGPAGQLIVTLNPGDGIIPPPRYEEAVFKREMDLTFQKWMGTVIAAIAAVLLVHWARVVFGRARMTAEGVQISGGPLVPFSALTELHAEQYARKGWLDVAYELNGQPGRLRLDDYKIKAFPAMIAEICRQKGWENPHEKWQEQKRAAAAK